MFAPRNSRPSEFRKQSSQKNSLQNASKKIPKKAIVEPQRVSLGTQTRRIKDLDLGPTPSPTVEPLPVSVASVYETAAVAEALRSCVSKREDFILVTDEDEVLVGIITLTDIVYRSLACGLDPRATTVSQVMTRDPVVAGEATTASDALEMMILNKIEHLPICNPNGNVIGLLQLKDAFQEYLDNIRFRFEASERLYKGISVAGIELCKELGSDETHATHMLAAAGKLLNKTAMPDFATIVALQGQTVVVKPTESVKKVARIMKGKRTSAVCVVEDIDCEQDNASPKILGLCTSWDIALRVAESGLGALQSSVVSVTNKSTMRVRPSMSTSEVARVMLKGCLSNILVVGTADRTPAIVNVLSIAAAIHHQLRPEIQVDFPLETQKTQTSLDVAPSTSVNEQLSMVNNSENLHIPFMNSKKDFIPNGEVAAQQDTNRPDHMATVGRSKTNPWLTLMTTNTSDPQLVRIYDKLEDTTANSTPHVREATAQQDTNRTDYMATVGRLKTNPWPILRVTNTTSDPQLVQICDKLEDNTARSIPHVRETIDQQDTNRANYMATVGHLKTNPWPASGYNNPSYPQFVRTYDKLDGLVISASPHSRDVTSEQNDDRSRVVAVVSRTEDRNQSGLFNVRDAEQSSAKIRFRNQTSHVGPNVQMENPTRVQIMALVGRLNCLPRLPSNDAPPDYHTNPEVGADALTTVLRKHHDIFRCYLPLAYLSEAYTIRSTIRLKLTALGGEQLYELSSDIFNELLRRLKIWTTGDIFCARFSSERNQFRRRLSEESLSHFQELVGDVYFELCRRYPALQEDVFKSRDMMVMSFVARLTEIFQDVSLYRQLLSLRESKAQRFLDLFQYVCPIWSSDYRFPLNCTAEQILDSPDLLPQFRRNLLVASQRLSSMSGLCPTCYELNDIELRGDHPVTSGGFADIYKGHLGGQTVCLKVIRLYQTSDVQSFIKRASAEAILWSQLQHPNLLPFYGLYRFNGRICLVSPWMDQVIKTFLDNNPDANRRLLVFDVVSGVAFLHAHDIVHGDLKGANILVNKLQRATIADFGLSSVSDPNILHWASHSTAQSKGGSVRWQAPELFDVVKDELVHNSKATDIYALACVAYEIFTGELPFSELGKLEATIMFRVKAGDRPSRPQFSSPAWQPMRLTDSLWMLMESCWVSQPQERPNIQEIAAHGDFHEPDTRSAFDADMIFPPHSRYSITSSSAVLSHDMLRNLLEDLNRLKDETWALELLN